MPRQSIVYRWWAQRWVELLDELSWEFEGRLAKARTFARNGSVTQLKVTPGSISAQVYGSWGDRYTVRVVLAPFSRDTWERITDDLAREASSIARLLANDLPPELEVICERAGVTLFPARLGEISASCTCPDAANPCKHMLAVLYAFGIQLDRDPALLLQLRGRTLSEIMPLLRARWSVEAEGDAAAGEVAPTAAESVALRPERFFEPGPELDAFAASFHLADAPPPLNAALLARLGRPTFASEREDPYTILSPVYERIGERALQVAKRSAKNKTPKRQAKRTTTTKASAAPKAQ